MDLVTVISQEEVAARVLEEYALENRHLCPLHCPKQLLPMELTSPVGDKDMFVLRRRSVVYGTSQISLLENHSQVRVVKVQNSLGYYNNSTRTTYSDRS